MTELPLFPLNTVLFPGTSLSLHIFEERYKLMIGRCLENRIPFGVVLIKSGSEVQGFGPAVQPYSVGCMAQIADAQPLDHGRMNIITVGLERFRIRLLLPGEPYLVGKIEPYPLEMEHSLRIHEVARRLRKLLARYAKLIGRTDQPQHPLRHTPSDDIDLTYLAASILQVPAKQKQTLLEATNALELVEHVYAEYRREVMLVQSMLLPSQSSNQRPIFAQLTSPRPSTASTIASH